MGILPWRAWVLASKVTNEKRPNKASVVRTMAQCDHCLWVSTPRWSLTSLKNNLQLSPPHEPFQNLFGLLVQVSAKQRLRFELAFRVPDQDPADRQRRHPIVIPTGSSGSDFNFSSSFALPVWKNDFLPHCPRVLQDLLQGRQALALLVRGRLLFPDFCFGAGAYKAESSRKQAINVIGWASLAT
jgi:hypothetical protein